MREYRKEKFSFTVIVEERLINAEVTPEEEHHVNAHDHTQQPEHAQEAPQHHQEEPEQSPVKGQEEGEPEEAEMTETDFAALLNEYPYHQPERGELLRGEVLWINKDSILVDVGAKRDAIIPGSDLSRVEESYLANLKVGDAVPVYVLRQEQDEELRVSLRRGLEEEDWIRATELLESQEIVELEVTGHNKGGLLVRYGRLEGFIPNSQIPALKFVRNPEERARRKEELVGTTLKLKAIEVDRRRRRLVFSAKAAEEALREKRLQELSVGDVVRGRVENVTDFGAFVDLGGVTGLIHVSKLDWQRVEHPGDVLKPGDEVEVLVEKIDRKRERISLNRQAVLPNPWKLLPTLYQPGDLLEGEVTNVVDFGIFVRIPLGIEGLVHNSEIQRPNNQEFRVVQPGDVVLVRITDMDPERERLGLSMRKVTPEEEARWLAQRATAQAESAAAAQAEADEPDEAASGEATSDESADAGR